MFRRPRDIPLGRLCSEHAARLCDELGWQIARVSVRDEREGWSVVDQHVRGGDPASTRAALAHSTSAAGLRERVREAEDVVLLGSVDDLSGVRAALAIPIHGADGANVAALELYSATPFADAAVIAATGRFVAWQIEEFAAAVHEHKRGQERFRALLEAAPDAMVIIDGSGTILLVNSQTEALFGLPRAELVGQTVEVLIPEHFRGSHPAHRLDYFSRPAPRAMGAGLTLAGRRADGREFPVEISLSPLMTERGPLAIAAIRDVSERVQSTEALAEKSVALERANAALRQKESELRRSNAELEDFAYAASHDLRAPLRAIRSLAGFLAEDLAATLPAASHGHLELLQARVKRMDALLASLLEHARVGRVATQLVKTRLTDVIDQARDLAASPRFHVVNAAPDVEIETVAVHLQRVLVNLIANAIKHHDRGEGRIEVGGIDHTDSLELWVEDDGPGIAEEFHERIFGLFQTLRPRDDVEGSGMGLSLVRKIVTLAGGVVRVVSSGRGSRFVFTWPKEWPP